ncbi:MAG: hypothetical protein ACD_20C00234G0007 [uncultured bacterium]|nr:MAG: hypothetical protein ACD_20C00234G0007 [uncultured bacterium]
MFKMFIKSKKVRRGLFAYAIFRTLPGILRTAVLIGAATGGIIKLYSQNVKSKQKPLGSGAYGAVAIAKAFKGADFPMSKSQIMKKYGDKEIEYHRGYREKVHNILENIPEGNFNSTADVVRAFHEYAD